MKRIVKRTAAFLLCFAAVCSLAACAQTPPQNGTDSEGTLPAPSEPDQPDSPNVPSGNVLVVYFSWSSSNNTGRMAEYIGAQTGGDVHELIPAVPYPSTPYTEWGNLARDERDADARPVIRDPLDASVIAQYDAVFVGYPIWWHTAPMIIGTFLESYEWNGTNIYPFAQSASMDAGQFQNSMEFVRRCADGANVMDGLFVRPSNTDAIDRYLAENGFLS